MGRRGGTGGGGRQAVDPFGLSWAEGGLASDWGIFLSATLQMGIVPLLFKSLAAAETGPFGARWCWHGSPEGGGGASGKNLDDEVHPEA
jgi:hypothetical protein